MNVDNKRGFCILLCIFQSHNIRGIFMSVHTLIRKGKTEQFNIFKRETEE